jgi:hypothetical protein
MKIHNIKLLKIANFSKRLGFDIKMATEGSFWMILLYKDNKECCTISQNYFLEVDGEDKFHICKIKEGYLVMSHIVYFHDIFYFLDVNKGIYENP